MMFLPAITESGKIKEVVEKVNQLGLTVRGVYGEGSSADGYMYQISNEVTLGVSEHEILNSVEETVITLCELERKTAETFYLKKEIQLIDRCKRAYAILSNAELLSYEEYIKLIASVKLGINLGVMEFDSPYAIDDLTIAVRPAHLSLSNN